MFEPQIAVISDIHGNRWALEAVLQDIERRGVRDVVNLGDSLYGPLDPAGTAGILVLWRREEVEGRDLDGDGFIGPPATTTRVELGDKTNNRIRYVDIPLSDDELSNLARVLLVRRVEWSRRNLADAGALVEERYSTVVDPMLQGGLLTYRGASPNSGLALTPPGRSFLRQYLAG